MWEREDEEEGEREIIRLRRGWRGWRGRMDIECQCGWGAGAGIEDMVIG